MGVVTIGLGVLRHGRFGPLVLAAFGLSFMAAGLFVDHGAKEAFLTITGVALLAGAHILNLRHTH